MDHFKEIAEMYKEFKRKATSDEYEYKYSLHPSIDDYLHRYGELKGTWEYKDAVRKYHRNSSISITAAALFFIGVPLYAIFGSGWLLIAVAIITLFLTKIYKYL